MISLTESESVIGTLSLVVVSCYQLYYLFSQYFFSRLFCGAARAWDLRSAKRFAVASTNSSFGTSIRELLSKGV